MSDVVQQVERALDAWEAAARDATPGPWQRWKTSPWIDGGPNGYDEVIAPAAVECGSYCQGGSSQAAISDANLGHIVLNDPAAVLRMVAGLRAVVAEHKPFECCNVRCPTGLHCRRCAPPDDESSVDFIHHPCPTLLAIAAMFPAPPARDVATGGGGE